jgi:hypothetical protein
LTSNVEAAESRGQKLRPTIATRMSSDSRSCGEASGLGIAPLLARAVQRHVVC